MLINLLEIPNEGKTFICNRNTAELNETLKDLIGSKNYQAEFTIRPLQAGTFELVGQVQTQLPEDCSRCGLDFDQPINESFKELLLPEQEIPRNSKFTKANHFSDMTGQGPSVVEYQGHHFNAGDYLHEVIGISEPLTPAPPCDAQGNCSLCKKPVQGQKFGYEDPGFEKSETPFAGLKNIKLPQ
ncbi:MAG: DUF177 domain-containing protein [Pseudobdellovibrionaceae bacterium]